MPTWTIRSLALATLVRTLPSSIVRVIGFSQYTSFPARGFDGDQGVPVVGSDDGNGVDVLAIEQLAEVAILFDALKL